jgi:hypothetical protein
MLRLNSPPFGWAQWCLKNEITRKTFCSVNIMTEGSNLGFSFLHTLGPRQDTIPLRVCDGKTTIKYSHISQQMVGQLGQPDKRRLCLLLCSAIHVVARSWYIRQRLVAAYFDTTIIFSISYFILYTSFELLKSSWRCVNLQLFHY